MEMTAIETVDATPIGARFTVDAKPLADALAFMTGRIIEKRNTVPILSNVVLVAWPGRVDILANDRDILARITIAADTLAPGAFTIDAGALLAIAKKAKPGARLELAQDDGRVIIDTGTSRARLPMLPADDFPMPTPIGGNCHAFTLSAEFMADIERLAPFMSTDRGRYYLQGIALQLRQLAGRDRLLIAATNGRELSAWSRPVPDGAGCLPDTLIPHKLVKALQGVRKLAGDLALSAECDQAGRWISLECGPVFLQSKLIDGTFPDIETVAAANIGDAPAQALLIPELDPDMNPATLERMAKATGAALSWENVGDFMLASDPANPDWFGMAGKGGMPKGYAVDYQTARDNASFYLCGLAERAGLDLGKVEHRRLIDDGAGNVQGLTIGAQVYVPAAVDYVQDWETLTMRRVETPARWEYAEGAYSIPMPRERQKLEAACSLTVDGETYPLATNARGDIHLSKEAVRKIIGESCFETMAITLPDGRQAFILKWLWDDGVTRFCTVRADGRCPTGKRDDGTAGIMVTRAEIERGAVAPIAAMESPAPIDEPAPENLAAEPVQPESAPDAAPNAGIASSAPEIASPVEIMPGDDLAARLDALEMAVKALQQTQAAPMTADDAAARPKRTPAHERAIRRAWLERCGRRDALAMAYRHRDARNAADDNVKDIRRELQTVINARDEALADALRVSDICRQRDAQIEALQDDMRAMRKTADQANAGLALAIDERNAARAELALLKRSLADPTNPLRSTDETRLIDEARELRATVASLREQNARMKAMCERGGDQLEAMIGRVTRAEAALRAAGLLSAPLALVAPDTVAA